jgi:hypothetical protein
MTRFQTGRVNGVLSERAGLQRVSVSFDGVDEAQRAYNLTELTGFVIEGDEVVCNTTAVELGLGTGGWHVVHWNLSQRTLDVAGDGHILKMRYTSLQANTGAAEEHHVLRRDSLDGLPVVACSLHSQVGVVAAAIAAARPGTRIAYVMTDGAALPIALSDLVATLVERGLLVGTVTAGHAFGGTYEAVNVPSGLLVAAELLDADVIIVGMGPGVVGTGTWLGHTALEVADIVHATVALGGRSIAVLRVSSADERLRHRGVSHHTTTALSLVRPGTVYVLAVPSDDETLLPDFGPNASTVFVSVSDVGELLGSTGLRITTMGREPAEDRSFFRFAAAAGFAAATMVG